MGLQRQALGAGLAAGEVGTASVRARCEWPVPGSAKCGNGESDGNCF